MDNLRKGIIPTAIITALFALVLIISLITPNASSSEVSSQSPGAQVLVVRINSSINPAVADYIVKAIERASVIRAEALIIELDTPGGLDSSMRSIIKAIQESRVPVVVYVAPPGARAASAGVFITIAAHVAAMAPGTNIGAAHPVALGEKLDKERSEKAVNDAAAYIKALAQQRGRNSAWAEEAVRKSVSIPETEALRRNIADLIAKDLRELLSLLDKRKVKLASGERILNTAAAMVVTEEPGFRFRVLNIIADPTIAYLLLMLGFYGLFFELTNPGAVLPGVIGSISLVLAFYALQTLPVNYAGILLIIIGIVLFLLEVKIASYGALTLGGATAVTLGSIMLFDTGAEFQRVSLAVILPVTFITAAFFTFIFRLAYRAHRQKHVVGHEALIGLSGVAKSPVGPEGGMVMIRGELWSASSEEPVAAGEKIIVAEVSGLRVRVIRADS